MIHWCCKKASFTEEIIDVEASVLHPVFQTIFLYLAPIGMINVVFICLLDSFVCFSCNSKRCEELFEILSMYSITLFMAIVLRGSDPISRNKVYGCLSLELEKLCKKMLLDILKLFPSGLKDATTSYFYHIEEH